MSQSRRPFILSRMNDLRAKSEFAGLDSLGIDTPRVLEWRSGFLDEVAVQKSLVEFMLAILASFRFEPSGDETPISRAGDGARRSS